MMTNEINWKKVLNLLTDPCLILYPGEAHFPILFSNSAFTSMVGRRHTMKCLSDVYQAGIYGDRLIETEQKIMSSLDWVLKHKEVHTVKLGYPDKPSSYDEARLFAEVEHIPVMSTRGEVKFVIHTLKNISPALNSDKKERLLSTSLKGLSHVYESNIKEREHKLASENKLRTELNTKDELLSASEEKYRTLFNLSPLPMWIFDVDTLGFIDVNEAAVRNYGYSLEEFLNMTIKDIRPEEDIPLLEAAVNAIKGHDRLYTKNVYRHKKKSGEIMFVQLEGNVVQLEGRKAELVLARDITSELAARKEADEANIWLKRAQEIAKLGYWTRDLSSGEMYWSDEIYNIYGLNRDSFEMSYQHLEDLFHPDDRYMLHVDLSKELLGTGVHDTEHRIITPAGELKWVNDQIRMVRDENGVPVRIEGVTRDITVQKTAEEHLARKTNMINATNRFVTELLESEDWITAIKRSFTIIGETVDVDRVYYYQNFKEGHNGLSYTSQKIEWTRNESEPLIDNPALSKVPFTMFSEVVGPVVMGQPFESLVKGMTNGPLRNYLTEHNVKSVLVLPVFFRGEFHGFMGFDDCKTERKWSEDEIAFLKTLVSNLETAIEKRNAEESVSRSRKQFKAVINNLPGITYRSHADNKWTMVFLSDEIKRMTGYAAEDIVNDKVRSFTSIIHPEDRIRARSILRNLKDGKPFVLEYRIVCSDGSIKWVEERGRGIYKDEEKKMLEWIDGVIIDITEFKTQDQLIKEANERFRLVMRATREAIIDWDIVADHTIWGDAFAELFGYDLSVYDNYLWSRNIHPHDKDRVLGELDAILKNPDQKDYYAEFRYLKANGEVAYVQHRGIFVRDHRGKPLRAIGSMLDVTEAMQRTLKIEKQNEALKEIAWTQSHVVRMPLANMLGLADILRNKEKMQVTQEEEAMLIEHIYEVAQKLDEIVHGIVEKSNSMGLNRAPDHTTRIIS